MMYNKRKVIVKNRMEMYAMWNWRDDGYCLDDFVTGEANNTAYHMAKRFVESSVEFDVLFVSGNIGCGKTYLAKTVETELLVRNKSAKMLNSDQFVGELIWYLGRNIENRAMDVFSKEYEKYDVLILDDIHFLEHKETTQKYFAYLLSRLVMKQKKVLITSVKELSEYKWLQDALSKYEVQIQNVKIQDADFELKQKIVEQLQKKWGYQLSEESKELIVEKAKDIRQLEGMFKKIMAYVQLIGVEKLD